MLCDEDVMLNQDIGRHGMELIKRRHEQSSRSVNVMTHCNARWLATVDWGTALAPVYTAFDAGISAERVGQRDAAAQPGRSAHRL